MGMASKYLTTGGQEEKPGTSERRITASYNRIFGKTVREINIRIIRKPPSGNKPATTKLQDRETEEYKVSKAKARPTNNEQRASNDSSKNRTELTSEALSTSGQEEQPATSEGRLVLGTGRLTRQLPTELGADVKELRARGNASESDKQKNAETEEDNGNETKRKPTKAEHHAGKKIEKKVLEVMRNDPPTSQQEDITRTSEEKRMRREELPGNIIEILAKITDAQLYRCTENRQEELGSTIKDFVENISETLVNERWMPELNVEEIRMLTGQNRRLAASQVLLNSILHGDIRECRIFWNILNRTQVNPQRLMTFLKQDVEREGILRYRYNLRVRNMNLKMSKLRLIDDIYTDPRIASTRSDHRSVIGESNNPVWEVEIHELLKGRSSDTDKTTISVLFGAAGMGKTTIIQKIIHDWAIGMIYDQFRFVLHFKIQNLNAVEGRTTLSGLIVDAYPYLQKYLDNLWKDPKRLLFIFDGLDQLHRSFVFSDNERNGDPRHRCNGPESSCLVNDILRCLLQGELLKGCSVLITARLWKLEMLRHVTVDSTFQVMGFSSEKLRNYFSRFFHHVQYAKCIVHSIEQNVILRNMCSSPLFCVTLASALESHQPQREEEATMPAIIHTQLLFDHIAVLLGACGYDDSTTQKSLIEVGELAYKGIKRNTLLFSLEADVLRDLNACPVSFTSAFMMQGTGMQSSGAVYGFKHVVVRDFLAALAKILNTPTSRLKGLLEETFMDPDGRFRTFSLFLVGLSSQNSVERLKLELGSDRSEVTSCVSEWLTKSVSRRLTNMDGKYTQRTLLHTLYCLLEFGDNQVTTEVLAPITTIKLNQILLTSPDCAVLARTLFYSGVIEELDLSSSIVQPESILNLYHLLHKCVILRLNQNNLQDSGVKDLFNILRKTECKIQTLELKSNHLTDDCLPTLFHALRTNRSLKQLNLSNSSQAGQHENQFTDEALQYHVDEYAQQKEIRWLRSETIGQDKASNILIFITE